MRYLSDSILVVSSKKDKLLSPSGICEQSASRDTRARDSIHEKCARGNPHEASAARKLVMRKLPTRLL